MRLIRPGLLQIRPPFQKESLMGQMPACKGEIFMLEGARISAEKRRDGGIGTLRGMNNISV